MLSLSLVSLTSCGTTDQFKDELSKAQEEQEKLLEEAKANQEELVDSILNGKNDAPEESPSETDAPSSENQKEETSVESSEPDAESETEQSNEISCGNHEIAGASFFFSKSVINDVTGKWRISTVNTSMSAEEYAADYYKELFSADDEIHGVVNFALNTTNRITVMDSKTLDVTIMDYVNGEEHDAKELFSGTVLAEYTVDIETGQVEKIN